MARDRHGLWVVVELKRDRSSSRQAVHEVAKYTELLCREKHLPADRIRAVIVATTKDWRELLAPVSNVARDWSHNLRGYRLQLNNDGTIQSTERVPLLPEAFEHRITPIHTMYFFHTAEDRRRVWQSITEVARSVGAIDLLAAEFDRVDRKELAPSPFGLYLAIGRIDSERASEELLDEYDGPEPFAAEYPREYLALCLICNRVAASHYRPGTVLEGAVPGRLRSIASSPDWSIRGYRGTGAFADASDFEESDLFRFLSGDDRGDSQITFTGSVNPQIATRWKGFLRETRNSLAGNEAWGALVRGWLDDAADRVGDGDVELHVYNPCDLLQALVHGWPDRLTNFLPMVLGAAVPESGYPSIVRGVLCWTGHGMDIASAVHLIHRDPTYWAINRWAGDAWQYDRELLDFLGLRYVLLEKIGPGHASRHLPVEHRLWVFRVFKVERCGGVRGLGVW